MKTIRAVSSIGVVVMLGLVLRGLLAGDLSVEGSNLVGMPWGLTSLADVYVGAALVLTWIRWRDGNAAGWLWLPVLLVFGHLASAAYVAWRSWNEPDVPTLLLGPRRTMAATVNPLGRS